jgi:hypothetical protein
MDSSRVGWKIDSRLLAIIAVIFLISCSVVGAAQGRAVPLEERAQGASQIVVATVTSVTPRWAENAFGDRLIISRLSLRVAETLKGVAAPSVSMDIEGGTLDGLTLRVSNLPALEPGSRAVFYLNAMAGGVYRPHLAGLGILELDDADFVRGSSLRLDTVRATVRQTAGSVQR